MGTIISNPLVWQQVLSQSNNVSYSARGIYRVKDTDPGRKADYWFRDFGMVMACSYMTELSFRIVDKLFTIPNITSELQLHKLSKLQNPVKPGELLYQNAQNYDRLPSVFQNRMMGTLIKGSSDLVPKIMREIEDHGAGEIKDESFRKEIQALLGNPVSAETNRPLDKALADAGIEANPDKAIYQKFKNLANLDNRQLRAKRTEGFLQEFPSVKKEALARALKLEDARQMGILIDHVQRSQNLKEYVIKKYLDDSKENKLKTLVPDFLKDYGEKVYTATQADQKELPKAIKGVWGLPPANRVAAFDKKFNEFKQHFFVRDGQSFLKPDDLKTFGKIGDKFRAVLSKETKAKREELDPVFKELATFHQEIAGKMDQHMIELAKHDNLSLELQSRLKKKIESTVADIHKLIPGKNPQVELETKLKELKLHQFFDANNAESEHVQPFIQQLKAQLPKESIESATGKQRAAISSSISQFMTALKKNGTETEQNAEAMVQRLLKPMLDPKKCPNGLDADALKLMVREALDSRLTSEAIKKVQSSSGWPKTFLTVAFNFVFYGLAASKFDNKILQPYEKKLVDERGTSQDIVNAGYLALVPGLAVLTQLFDKTTPIAAIRRMGNLSRFSMVGGLALATFAGSTYGILQQLLKTPPKNPPKQPTQNTTKPGASLGSSPNPQSLPTPNGMPSPFANPNLNRGGFNGFQHTMSGLPVGFGTPQFGSQAELQARQPRLRSQG